MQERRFAMPTAMEQRLDRIVHELNEIKKEMILQKLQPVVRTVRKINAWKSLGEKISVRWDHVSAVDEIRQQRDRA
jgi:SPX domain protein involved in polyphosphate accumulation